MLVALGHIVVDMELLPGLGLGSAYFLHRHTIDFPYVQYHYGEDMWHCYLAFSQEPACYFRDENAALNWLAQFWPFPLV